MNLKLLKLKVSLKLFNNILANESIFRCKRCSAYINNKFELSYNKSNRRIAKCNLCQMENEMESNPAVKSEYYSSDTSSVPELSIPTVDFIAPSLMKGTTKYNPHYLFMIDCTQMSQDLGLTSYILNSISTNLDYIHNKENSFVSLATYDHNSIHFYALDKNKEVRVYKVSDVFTPFCPLPVNQMYLHCVDQREDIEKVIEKVQVFIQENTKAIQASKRIVTPGSVTGAALAAGVDSLAGNGGRVLIFTCNACINGIGATKPRDDKIINTENEHQILVPQNDHLKPVAEQCLKNKAAVDLFVFANSQFDLATFSSCVNQSGGSVNYYPTDLKDLNDTRYHYEKLHYDISRILTRPNYTDVRFMLRYSVGIDIMEILGPFNKRLGDGFALAGCDPDYSFCYNLRLNDSFKKDSVCHFQLVALFTDNFGEKYIRMFNYSLGVTNDLVLIYNGVDIESMIKAICMKECLMAFHNKFTNVKANIVQRVINCLYFYRSIVSKGTPLAQLVLPASVKYIPVYMNAFMKKPVI